MNENEKRLCYLFDDAMKLRDAGDLVGARRMLTSLVEQLRPEDVRLLSHAHLQLGYIFKLLGDHRQREAHFRAATVATPNRELASLGLYHALYHQGRLTEALQEMVRLLRLRYSELYWELLSPRYAEGLSAEQQALIAEARRLLARHRRN